MGRNGGAATAETWWEKNTGRNRRKLKERIGKKKLTRSKMKMLPLERKEYYFLL